MRESVDHRRVGPRRAVRAGVLRCLYVTQTAVAAITNDSIWTLLTARAVPHGYELVRQVVQHGNSSYGRSWLRQQGFYDRRFSRRYMQFHKEAPTRWSSAQIYNRLVQRSYCLAAALRISSSVSRGDDAPPGARSSLDARLKVAIPYAISKRPVAVSRLSRKFLITQAD